MYIHSLKSDVKLQNTQTHLFVFLPFHHPCMIQMCLQGLRVLSQ